MSNSFTILRTLLIYGICLPLAIWLGYSLATPDDRGTLVVMGLIFLVLLLPLLLKWHHPLLVLSWNLSAVAFFLPGQLQIWVVMVGVSLGVSLLQRSLNRGMKFLPASPVILPLIVLAVVIFTTAQLTGGISFRAGGSGTYGGKRYFLLFAAILGFFALISRRIPLPRASWYVGGFILSGVTAVIANLVTVVNPALYFIFLLFPGDFTEIGRVSMGPGDSISRMGGVSTAASCGFFFLLARYGIRGLLGLRNIWRLLLLVLALGLGLYGGYRSTFIAMMIMFGLIFYYEGLVRSRLMPILLIFIVLSGAILLPFMNKLPLPVQRTFSFLPVRVDPVAAADAQVSTEWRVQMWKQLLPEIPRYLILGKGYGIKGDELEFMERIAVNGGDSAAVAALAGDYHNGPLSVIIPLGIWGVIGFGWFLMAAVKALYWNHKHGEPELKLINTFLLAYFLMRVFMFFVIVGSLYVDLVAFTGLVGLSVSLNGGICRAKGETKPIVAFKKSASPPPQPIQGLAR